MIRLLLSAALSLALAGCKPSGLQTIEEGETYAQAHGVVLTGKKENTSQAIAPRAYDYSANGVVKIDITQFASEHAAATWKKTSDELPLSGDIRIQKGSVVFIVWGATDAERQRVVDLLK